MVRRVVRGVSGLVRVVSSVVRRLVGRVVPSKKVAASNKKVAARKVTKACKSKKCSKPCGKRGQVVQFRQRTR